MDELEAFCRRLIADPETAEEAARASRKGGLAAAVRICREHEVARPPDGEPEGLPSAVAAELRRATGELEPAQREALALRDLLGLGHDRLAEVLGLDHDEVAPLLARSRIQLRATLRGTPAPAGQCPEHERTLRVATLRQDGEPVDAAEEDWLFEHLGGCPQCAQAHAAMLEGATCYRGWPV